MKFRFLFVLFSMAMACFAQTAVSIFDRMQFTENGVQATIARANDSQHAPTDWAESDGVQRSVFDVRMKMLDGSVTFNNLYLRKDVIEALVNGEERGIVFVSDNPRRFIMNGDPIPSFEFWWSVLGVGILVVFMRSLRAQA